MYTHADLNNALHKLQMLTMCVRNAKSGILDCKPSRGLSKVEVKSIWGNFIFHPFYFAKLHYVVGHGTCDEECVLYIPQLYCRNIDYFTQVDFRPCMVLKRSNKIPQQKLILSKGIEHLL